MSGGDFSSAEAMAPQLPTRSRQSSASGHSTKTCSPRTAKESCCLERAGGPVSIDAGHRRSKPYFTADSDPADFDFDCPEHSGIRSSRNLVQPQESELQAECTRPFL